MTIPEQGQLVQVRNRHFVVLDVEEPSDCGRPGHTVTLELREGHTLGGQVELVCRA